eukprot:gene32420-39203_t
MTLKDKDEQDAYVMHLFTTSIASTTECSNGAKKHTMAYNVDGVPVCKTLFALAFNISVKKLESASLLNKVDPLASTLGKARALNERSMPTESLETLANTFVSLVKRKRIAPPDAQVDHSSMLTTNDSLESTNTPHVLDIEDAYDFARAALTPLSESQQYCEIWMRDAFYTYGDHAPNENGIIFLNFPSKKSVHDDYKKYCKQTSIPAVDYKNFVGLWQTLFPKCVLRSFVSIPGKCDTCYEINRQRTECRDSRMQTYLKQAHELHRGGLFMLERKEYKRRVLRAKENSKRILSFIIDGMDQHHCKVPYMGTQQSFPAPLTQHIVGVKNHSTSHINIYRTFGTVSKGANLIIHCILRELEDWNSLYNNYPEEIYIQVDGGSENANKYVLAMLELLVVKRFARVIFYTRLPTGHTHEEIDAIFGSIWNAFKNSPCLTLSQYKRVIESVFSSSNLQTEVRDLFIIPDYVKIIGPCIDGKFQRLHKEEYTQHQWRFEAVAPSVYFPGGCKTVYRAYSSEKVVELVFMDKDKCSTELGFATGLEPTTTLVRWYPFCRRFESDSEPIEGFYILQEIPCLSIDEYPIMALADSCRIDMMNTLSAVIRQFGKTEQYREVLDFWNNWCSKFIPDENSTAVQYRNKIKPFDGGRYHCPLKRILFQRGSSALSTSWKPNINVRSVVDPGFQWPESVSFVLPSVQSSLMPSPHSSRYLARSDSDRLNGKIQLYRQKTGHWYEGLAASNTVPFLQLSLKRKAARSGLHPSIAGSKAQLVSRIKTEDILLYSLLMKPLTAMNVEFLESAIGLYRTRFSALTEEDLLPTPLEGHFIHRKVIQNIVAGYYRQSILANQFALALVGYEQGKDDLSRACMDEFCLIFNERSLALSRPPSNQPYNENNDEDLDQTAAAPPNVLNPADPGKKQSICLSQEMVVKLLRYTARHRQLRAMGQQQENTDEEYSNLASDLEDLRVQIFSINSLGRPMVVSDFDMIFGFFQLSWCLDANGAVVANVISDDDVQNNAYSANYSTGQVWIMVCWDKVKDTVFLFDPNWNSGDSLLSLPHQAAKTVQFSDLMASIKAVSALIFSNEVLISADYVRSVNPVSPASTWKFTSIISAESPPALQSCFGFVRRPNSSGLASILSALLKLWELPLYFNEPDLRDFSL